VFSVKGRIITGFQHFQKRMTLFHEVFQKATGEALYPGTLNVKVDREIPIEENFRIIGTNIGEPGQDLLFEKCLINGIAGYRIRPYKLEDGTGGHGDDIVEISSASFIPGATPGCEVEVTFQRREAL
jgi:CTP-dependent riboflavin kinase